MANHLPLNKKTLVLSALVEGNSICSIVRITGVNKRTILRLLCEAGLRAQDILDTQMVGIESRYIQVDEIWTFVNKKQKQLTDEDRKSGEFGDQYVFVALDADTKLIPAFCVGKRSGRLATSFMTELRTRIATRFQLSTDSYSGYSVAVDRVFGTDVDYAQIHKHYGEDRRAEKRYSPPQIIGITIRSFLGQPKPQHISTSYVERQNLTMRMQMRRFTRLTNAFSKKLENIRAALALHFFHYNFMRIHQSLRVTPAMEAGISKHIWTWGELLGVNGQAKEAA